MATDTSQYYKDPTTGTTYTSFDVFKQYNPTGVGGAAGTPGGANLSGGQVTPPQGPVPVAQTATQTPLNLASTIPTPTDNATPLVAGAQVASKDIATTVAESTKPLTTEQIAAQQLNTELSGLYQQDTGKANALSAAEASQGVPDMTKQLNDINSEINIKNAEYQQLNTNIEGKPIPLVFQTGQKAQVAKQQASDIGLLVARAQAIQGNLTLAKETAAKAVDLKYEWVEDQIKVKLAQLDLLKPTLNKQDAAQADFIKQQKQDELNKIAEEKAKIKENLALAFTVGIKTQYVNRDGTFFRMSDGKIYATPEELFRDSGAKSFEELYSRGLVGDLNAATLSDRNLVEQARAKYTDVNIPFNATPEQVAQIIKGSRIYQKDNYIAPVGGDQTSILNQLRALELLGKTQTTTGQVINKATGLPVDISDAAATKISDYQNLIGQTTKVKELLNKLSSTNALKGWTNSNGILVPVVQGKLDADQVAAYQELQRLSNAYVYALSGKQINEQEFARIAKTIPDIKATSGNNDRVLQNLEAYTQKSLDNYLNTNGWGIAQDSAQTSAAPPKGTDGTAYGFPGYVSDGTAWVLK